MSKSKGGKAPVREKNEYIPKYISRKPFYIDDDAEGDYLEHQRLQQKQPTDLSQSQWYVRGKRAGPAATKYRKGACENCGAMTHKTKECLSRPRKLGAKWTGKDIQADEVIQDVELGWDAKRDRWNGYDAREHSLIIDEYNQLEEMKKREKDAKERDSRSKSRDLADGEEDVEENDEDKYAESTNAPGQTFDAANRISTRNLRIREDTAKYLLNLDLNSAKYDPKTRTMVNTKGGDGPSDAASLALLEEQNFMRSSGDAAEFERMQKYAWETREKGGSGPKIHLQANPTHGELHRKAELTRIAKEKEDERNRLLEKYGGEEYLAKKQEDLLPVPEESEAYVEYTSSGQLKLPPGATKAKPKSKYVENKYIGNHTSVWGSWWKNFQWGYSCCHSTIKNSYCTGEEGKKATLESANLLQSRLDAHGEMKEAAEEKQRLRASPPIKQNEHNPEIAKRKLDAMLGGVTEEEMEEYRKQKRTAEDPMARYLSTA